MFATPVAYLIDEAGILADDVAVGLEPILALFARAAETRNDPAAEPHCRCGQPLGQCNCGKKAKATAGRHNGR
jgi:hypothetical protein